MHEDWSQIEVELIVSDYLSMLQDELRGSIYNKAEHNRILQKLLPGRSRGSIEFKHQNISAALLEMGYPYVDGYKPRVNFQALLSEVLSQRLANLPDLSRTVEQLVEEPAPPPRLPHDVLSIQVEPPEREKKVAAAGKGHRLPSKQTIGNYLEMEARNSSLGLAGEQLALDFEHKRLWQAGKKALADRIEHISRTQGDGAGYDIHSFEASGQDRLIEVKTTRFGALTPFFASRKEVEVSDARHAEYHLYRLFRFDKGPLLFLLSGSLHQTCDLETAMYRATPGKIGP